MLQCLMRGQSLGGIKVGQTTNNIFQVRVDILQQREWLTGISLVEAVP